LGTATVVPSTASHSGTWRVSHHSVRVNHSTRIIHEGRLGHGSTVRVFGSFLANGAIRALKIVVKN